MNQKPKVSHILAEIALFAFLGPVFACIWLAFGMGLGFWGHADGAGPLAFISSIAVMTPFALMFGFIPAASAGALFAALRWAFWGTRYPAYWLCALLGSSAGLTVMGGLTGLIANKGRFFIFLMPAFAGAMCAIFIRLVAGTTPEPNPEP
ncbi:hypothetical protein CO613_09385 [Lysobacteraceae bacterium NML07-0707]|nr:hypothetical protein CO613_09385 [Xanthomonadaceae bacterium NML07-0707]